MNTEQHTHQDGRVVSGVRKRRLTRYNKQERAALLREYDQGNESQKDFCAAREVNLGTFKGWLQKRAKSSSVAFAQVEVALPRHAAIDIALPNGVRIGIDHRGKQSDLIALIRGVAGC